MSENAIRFNNKLFWRDADELAACHNSVYYFYCYVYSYAPEKTGRFQRQFALLTLILTPAFIATESSPLLRFSTPFETSL